MANITFKLRTFNSKRPQPIYLVYRFGRNDKLVYPTGLKVLPAHWNKEKMRVRNIAEALGREVINNRLNELCAVSSAFVIEQRAKGRQLTKAMLRKFLNDYTNATSGDDEKSLHGFIKSYLERNKTRINSNTGKVISYKVKREHERTYKLLTEFEEKKNKGVRLDFGDITLDFYADFTTYLQTLGLSVNTIGHKIQTLKAWLNEATERGFNKSQQYKSHRFKAVTEETESIYLSNKELEMLYNYSYSSERLSHVRDLFLIGSFTGLRFSDFTSITVENMRENTLHIEQQKTGKPVSIPLHPIVLDIWKKYEGKLPKIISNQKFNKYIKEACKFAGINESQQKNITKGGMRMRQTYKKYELVSSHTARRSFATNLFLSGFPALSIMQVTGHRTERAFMRYIKVTPEQHAVLLREHWAQNGDFLRVAK
jgi:site-specific recombinase XerD